MKEIPILFSGPMISAIIDGKKTQTRWIIKPQPIWIADPFVPFKTPDADPNGIINCPYGVRGHRLWLKEVHYLYGCWVPDLKRKNGLRFVYHPFSRVRFQDDEPKKICTNKSQVGWFKRSPLFMPKWAARTWLENTGVRIERLQDISEKDALAEGFEDYDDDVNGGVSAREQYLLLWQSIYGADWFNADPFVWVITFKVVEK